MRFQPTRLSTAVVMSANTSPTRCSPLMSSKYSAAIVKGEERLRLSLEDLETVGDRCLTVVRTPFTIGASSKSPQKLVVTDPEIDDGLKLDVHLLRQGVCGLRLAYRSRKAIEHEPSVLSRLENR